MAKSTSSDIPPSINFIGSGTNITGDIKSNGDFRIDGNLTGSINSKGKIVIGQSGKVDGEIVCQNADISGEIRAKVIVHELLTLKATAILTGDIYTSKLAIEPGAIFTGACNMNEIPGQIKPELLKKSEVLKPKEAVKVD
ncbi:MAG: polymer-forming cytoskeletal protein [Bacteroidales bacterium]|nr:polymer-forming cytoskeletal protein [Bacteroidales bacterium]